MTIPLRPPPAAILVAFTLLGAGAPAHSQSAPTLSVPLSFNSGFVFLTNDFVYPPDTMGAAGPDQYVQLINGGYGIYNKTDGTPIGTLKNDVYFWAAAGISLNTLAGGITDPRLLFDPSSQRWFATELTDPGQTSLGQSLPNQVLLAVSNDANPLDGFHGYTLDPNPSAGGQNLNADFDMLGLDSQTVTVGAPLFDAAGNNAGADLFSVSKTDLLAGVALPAISLLYNVNSALVGQVPHPTVNLDGGADTYFLADNVTPGGTNVLSHLTGGTVSSLTVPVTPYGTPPLAREPDGSGGVFVGVDTNDPRYSGAVLTYHGIIYGTQSVQDLITGAVDIRLVGIDPATGRTVLDQLIASPAGQLDYYFPSLAINPGGQMVIGFTGSGPLLYPSAFALAGQLDAAGDAVTFGTPQLLRSGDIPWAGGRWGDYSATTVDPNDSNTFWTTQEISDLGANRAYGWTTNISELHLSPAADAPIPEPPPLALLALGLPLVGLALRTRRRVQTSRPGRGAEDHQKRRF